MPAASSSTTMRAPIWPVFAAPLLAGLYYLSIRGAFTGSIVAALGADVASDIDFDDITSPVWGSHILYRLVAETISMGIAIGIAGGIARGRVFAGVMAGAGIISLGFLLRLVVPAALWMRGEIDTIRMPEPWYQYVLDGMMVFAAPTIALYLRDTIEETHRKEAVGIAGIRRRHLFWMWILAYWYGLALITPLSYLYTAFTPDKGFLTSALIVIVHIIPALASGIPAAVGMMLLSGRALPAWRPWAREFLGILVLVLGLVVGLAIQYGWHQLMMSIWSAITGWFAR